MVESETTSVQQDPLYAQTWQMADSFTAAKASDIKHDAPEGDADNGIEVRNCLGAVFTT